MKSMRRIIFLKYFFLIVFYFISSRFYSQNYHWVKDIGGKSGDAAWQIAKDSYGNIYVLGYFNDTVDFDPGPGVAILISNNVYSSSAYLLKLDSIGNFIWVKKFGEYGYFGVRSSHELHLQNFH